MQMKMNDFKYVITMVGKLTSVEHFFGITTDNKVYYCPRVAFGFPIFKMIDVVLKGRLCDVDLDLVDFTQCKGPTVSFTPPEVKVFKQIRGLFKTKMQLVYKGYALDSSMFRIVSILTSMKDGQDIQKAFENQVNDMIAVIAYDPDDNKIATE